MFEQHETASDFSESAECAAPRTAATPLDEVHIAAARLTLDMRIDPDLAESAEP